MRIGECKRLGDSSERSADSAGLCADTGGFARTPQRTGGRVYSKNVCQQERSLRHCSPRKNFCNKRPSVANTSAANISAEEISTKDISVIVIPRSAYGILARRQIANVSNVYLTETLILIRCIRRRLVTLDYYVISLNFTM